MNIKKYPLVAGLCSLYLAFAPRAGKAYEGEISVMDGVFAAPIDKVLGVSDGKVLTYRSQAKYTSLTNGTTVVGYDDVLKQPIYNKEVVTNAANFVSVSLDGKSGFATGKGSLPLEGNSLMNKQTGTTTTLTDEGLVIVSKMADAKGLTAGLSAMTNMLTQATNPENAVKLTDPIAYLYDDQHLIILTKDAVNTYRATKQGEKFVVTKQNGLGTAAYRPTMAVQSSEKVYFSDGSSIISYSATNEKDATKASVPNATGTIKEMEVAGDKLFWTSGTKLYSDGTSETDHLRGAEMTSLASDGTTLYVGNVSNESYSIDLNGVTVQYVPDAVKLISAKENNKTVIYKQKQDNTFQRVN